jgi:hypothetical protein
MSPCDGAHVSVLGSRVARGPVNAIGFEEGTGLARVRPSMRGTKLRGLSFALCAWGLVATSAVAGCDVFDEGLIPTEPVEPDGKLVWGENITCNLPKNVSRNQYHAASDIEGAGNDRPAPSCVGGGAADGPDVFFQIDMNEGDKWHFHIEKTAGIDPLVYVTDSCSNRDACLSGINACGANDGEHFSFIAPASGEFIVGVDSLTPAPNGIGVLAVRADCLNGIVEHSEYCDIKRPEGTILPDDSYGDCRFCRKLIPNGGDDGKASVNDGPFDAAILDLPPTLETGQTFSWTGVLEKSCDFDFFSFELEEPANVTATIVRIDTDDTAGWDLRIDDDANAFRKNPSEDAYPSAKKSLRADKHWVRVAGAPELEAANATYEITLTFDFD